MYQTFVSDLRTAVDEMVRNLYSTNISNPMH